MDTLHNYMVSSPLPCVYFVISDKKQMKIYSLLSTFNKSRNLSKSERFYLKVVEKESINEPTTNHANWFEKVVEEPTCVVYCSDWQRYKVESSKVLGTEIISDPSLVNILSKPPESEKSISREQSKKENEEEGEPSEPSVIRITNKNLEKLIREDIEKFLALSRKVNENKTVPHKFLLLVTLNKNIKSPNKVIGGLKNLDPGEVCAVCVSCGMTDINSKLEKLEQMIYETSISYYEKKIKKITKSVINIKSHMKVTANEITELYYILLNFKTGYLSEFLSNRKEAYSKYAICWSALRQMNAQKSLIDKTSMSFFTCLRMLDYLFHTSDIAGTFTIYGEYKEYLESMLKDRYRGLYYNLMYLVNYFIAYKLEQSAVEDERNTRVLMQQAANYYKWTVSYLIKLRKHILELSTPMVLDGEKMCKYYLPSDLNNVFYYEDGDYGHLYDEKKNGTDEMTENEFEFRGDALELFQVLEEERLESETIKLVMKNFKVYKNLNHANHMLYVYALLGDSFYLGNNCREALKIYIVTLKHILYNINFTQNYAALVRKYGVSGESKGEGYTREKSKSIHYVHVVNMLVYSELAYTNIQRALYIKVLSKAMVALLMLLNVEKIPPLMYELSSLPYNDISNRNVNASKETLGEIMEEEEEEEEEEEVMREGMTKESEVYKLILIKSMTTFISVYDEENSMQEYLDYLIEFFRKSRTSPGNVTNNAVEEELKHGNESSVDPLDSVTNDTVLKLDKQGIIDNKMEKQDDVASKGKNEVEEGVVTLESCILLSKYSKSQYIYKYDNGMIEIIVNFQTDLSLKLKFAEGHLDTSEGLLSFYYKTSQYSANTFIIYTNQLNEEEERLEDELKKKERMVELPNDKRIILMIQMPFYAIKSIKIYGMILKTYYRDKMVINSIVLTNQYVINNYFKKLYYVINLGYYTSQLHLTNHFGNSRDDKDGKTLANLINLSLNESMNRRFLEVEGSNAMDMMELMKLMNMNMKIKIFSKNAVRNFITPITIVILHNKRFHHLYSKFAYQLQVEHNDFYVYGKEGDEYVLWRTNVVEFDFNEALKYNEENERPENIKLSQKCGKYRMFEYGEMKDPGAGEREMDEEMVKYINIYKNNYKVHVLYGLMNVNNDIENNVKFNLHVKDMNEGDDPRDSPIRDTEKLLKKEGKKNILLYTKILEVNVNSTINVNVNYKYYNNNMLLYINLINNTEVAYQLLKVNILYNNYVLTDDNSKLHGYKENVMANETVNFAYVIEDYEKYNREKKGENTIQIQITEYIHQKLNYPFNQMKNFLKFTTNKFINLAEKSTSKIQLKMKHKYIATLGKPVELEAEITNTTEETMEYEVTVTRENTEEKRGFILQGPLNLSLIALPKSSDTLKWTLIPTRCKIFKVPVVQVLNKLDSTKKTKVTSSTSQIYVVP
ncbi:uncharacterized protein TOT_040000056 [Theileria orientalis strain Shintoku]|uniref:Trafficking protein particle complex subunit 11 domain-containing protein n=1 Tax=Theileria orientalis strain Shintoku TaxID=869250 RepID=J4D9Y6_THEOR|nr:uncharacterized protein TOT_040000056 [Theileria orientalis strain Shintoku]BAM41675.1 uncharacterized protein TOT_040000056 [Theileria orientalis strain Shintoku]|eukprot:XP_009691976.1 uncharacterized protein TOT_040000056 [Theileria orientalis strain Shintoku]